MVQNSLDPNDSHDIYTLKSICSLASSNKAITSNMYQDLNEMPRKHA